MKDGVEKNLRRYVENDHGGYWRCFMGILRIQLI